MTFGLTQGQYKDFNPEWFFNIGNILVGTMWFNAWYPILEALLYYGMRLFFRCLDRGCSCNKYKTKTISPKSYVEIYAGPTYFMHFKYSTMMNVVFVTFMFGLGMPILFPIAFLSMVVLYFAEKVMLYWTYRLPPMYDERLSKRVLSMLKWAPIFYLSFGYWMASNQQLLSNDYLGEIMTNTDP